MTNDLDEILFREPTQDEALRNVADVVMELTTVTRHYNGRGRTRTYNGNVDAIAAAARQLAEMVLVVLEGDHMNLLSTSEALQQINERLSNPVSKALFHQSILPLLVERDDAQLVGNSVVIDGAALPAWISYLCWREQQIASGALSSKSPYSTGDMESLFLGELDTEGDDND